MIQNSWKQIWNQRKKNSWIAIELLLIFCLTWYIVDFLFVLGYNKSLPSYRDNTNTYMLGIAKLPDQHLDYSEQESEPSAVLTNFRRIVDRLKEHPDVESVTIVSGYDGFPETGSKSSSQYRNIDDTTKIAESQFIRFMSDEDYLKVFRHTTDHGKKAATISDYDWNDPSHVLITRMLEEKLFPEESAIGRIIERTHNDPEAPRYQYRVIGILDDVKHQQYARPNAVVYLTERLNEQNATWAVIGFRTKGNHAAGAFIQTFKKEMSSKLRIGNFYLQDLNAFSDIATDLDYRSGTTNMIRLRTALMFFFLISFFLCILGTFWYRVNVRREEIGVRRAMGSKANNIGKLFIQEGLILLTIIVPFAMIIETQFLVAGVIDTLGTDRLSYGRFLPDQTVVRFLITNAITWIIMATMTIVAIWYPAWQASRMNPVDALRNE